MRSICLFLLYLTIVTTATAAVPGKAMPTPQQIIKQSVISALKAKIGQAGTVRVIIGLEASGVDFNMSRTEASRTAKADFLGRHATIKVVEGHDYPVIPFFLAEITGQQLAELADDDQVSSVEEDFLLHAGLAQSAPLVSANTAWSLGMDGTGQAVAIVDTGVDAAHPFLGGRVVQQACFSTSFSGFASACPNGGPTQTGSGSGLPCSLTVPGCSHGTHVAGIAAGSDPGGVGFSGIAKNASIIGIQVFGVGTTSGVCSPLSPPCAVTQYSDVVNALNYVYGIANTYSIASVNMSIYTFTSPWTTRVSCDLSSSAFASIVSGLRDDKKVASVGIAGNDGYTIGTSFPGCLSAMVNVGASTKSDTVWSFSNTYPSMLDLLAPGDGYVAGLPPQGIQSSLPGNTYGYMTGTSMAAPHVAGAFAILKQASPNAEVGKLLNDLVVTGLPITDTRNSVVTPRINIASALGRVDTTPPTVPGGVTAEALSTTSIQILWAASTDTYGVSHYDVQRRDTRLGAWHTIGSPVYPVWSDSSLPAAHLYEYRVAAVDTSGNMSAYASDFGVTVPFTDDPIVAGTTAIKGVHQADLRKAADAWRVYAGLSPAWGSYAPLTGSVLASDLNSVVTALNAARLAIGLPSFTFAFIGGTPAIGGSILATHVQQLRDSMR